MHSSTSSFERPSVSQPWAKIILAAAILTVAATTAWELHCRQAGYRPTLNDDSDLWARRRAAVKPDSLVLIGDSRMLFNADLDEIERGLGQRPVQLSLAGTTPYPVLSDLADDETFRGTVICSLLSELYFAPAGPPLENSEKAVRYYHSWSPSQQAGHWLGSLLQGQLAFIRQEDLTLNALLKKISLPERAGTMVPPRLPPYFYTVDAERRGRMIEQCEQPGPLQDRVKLGWIPLFTPPPPPAFVPPEAFQKGMMAAIEARFQGTREKVAKIRARGGRVVFVEFPSQGPLREIENKVAPRAAFWDRVLNETGAPGINFADHPELAAFTCPEWSHLSAGDSIEYTRRLVPHLQKALDRPNLASTQPSVRGN